LLPGRRSKGIVTLAAGPKFSEAGADGEISVVVRPENLLALSLEETAEMVLEGTVRDFVYLGSHVKYKVAVEGGSEMIVHARPNGMRVREVGERMRIGWLKSNHRIVDA
jgi:ABC-type Fe3+/spermidine/putrescine transport system ATPase subunit